MRTVRTAYGPDQRTNCLKSYDSLYTGIPTRGPIGLRPQAPVRAESSCTTTPSIGSTGACHGAPSIMARASSTPAASHGMPRRPPGRALDNAPRVVEPRLPARAEACRGEVDVLPVILARE